MVKIYRQVSKSKAYIPEQGDIVYLDFDPQAGNEHSGRRPALVMSKLKYNKNARLTLVCPITSHQKGYPFEVRLPMGLKATGVILADQVKSIDWAIRRAEFIDKAPKDVIIDVISMINTMLNNTI